MPITSVPQGWPYWTVDKTFFIPATQGYYTGTINGISSYPVIELANAAAEHATHLMRVPDDFLTFVSVRAVWQTPDVGNNNLYWRIMAAYSACAELYTTHTDTPAHGVTASGGADIKNCQEPANPLTLVSLARGDTVGIIFARDATNPADTIEDDVYLYGLEFNYIGEIGM